MFFLGTHLISSHFISFHLISSHFISFHLISSHFYHSAMPMSLNLCQKQTKLRKSIALTSQISLVILRLLHVLLPQMHQLAPTQQAAMLGFKFVFKPFQGYIELGLIWKMLLPPIQISQYWKKIHLNSNGQINSLEKLFCVLLPTQVEFTKTKPPFVCFSLIFSPPILQ